MKTVETGVATEGDLELKAQLARREKKGSLKATLSSRETLPCGCKPQVNGDNFLFENNVWVHAKWTFTRGVIRVPAGGCGKPLFSVVSPSAPKQREFRVIGVFCA